MREDDFPAATRETTTFVVGVSLSVPGVQPLRQHDGLWLSHDAAEIQLGEGEFQQLFDSPADLSSVRKIATTFLIASRLRN